MHSTDRDPSSRTPRGLAREPSFAISTHRLGLYVLFGSLSVLFGSSLVGFVVARTDATIWRPPGAPALPLGLWVSGALVIGISVALQSGLRAARKNLLDTCFSRLAGAAGLALLFLTAQSANWAAMHQSMTQVLPRTLRLDTFYLLTGLHALHVVGGLVPLGIVLSKTRRREYSSSRHEGLVLCVQYWHYLSIVWLILFAALKLGSD